MELSAAIETEGDVARQPALGTRPVDVPRLQARLSGVEQRARGLGWFSIGLGLCELIAPRQVARWIGADEDDDTAAALLMGTGVRELGCGLGLLSGARPAAWAWARFAGDLMDLALVGYLWQRSGGSPERALTAGGTVLGVALLDAQAAVELGRESIAPLADGILVQQVITVQTSPEQAYHYFRDFENLPRFMHHLEAVEVTNGRSHWRARGPLGTTVEWDAELVDDQPGSRIAWRSLPGASVPNRGVVEFRPAPGGLGTEIEVALRYDPPAGAIGATIAQLFGTEPAQSVSADLRRLKQVLETGEVLHSDASIHRGLHPARPARQAEPTNPSEES